MRYAYVPLVLFLALIVSGCGGNTPAPPPEPEKKAEPPAPPAAPTEEPEASDAPASPGDQLSPEAKAFQKAMEPREIVVPPPPEPVLTAEGDDPAKVVEELGKAVADKKLQALWEALPASYQKELQETIVEFGNKLDKTLWKTLVMDFQLAVYGMKAQKERFFNHRVSELLPLPKETLEKIWDPLINIGDALLDSQLYTVETIQKFDPAVFLASTGVKIIDNIPPIAEAFPNPVISEVLEIYNSLGNVKATKVSGDDTSAVVKIEVEGHDPVEVEFVKVEDKWIPKELESQWPAFMTHIKDVIAMIPTADTPEGKKEMAKLKQTLSIAGIGVTLVAGTDTDKRFDENVKFAWKQIMKEDFPSPESAEKKEGSQEGKAEAEATEETTAEPATPSADEPKAEETKEPAEPSTEPKEESEQPQEKPSEEPAKP